ncbi:hypothetical protein BDY19DRAFT_995692 [Irpex rosettiformis]|uniref:Uncharacterized protein n=1 Tax=Irpex rosettiformis TaxID=378272 RepID=A0ACB8TXH4_9APHY|nr:hypothetical protein BDY19DRAFT_995692 [Irpex rosettiformis]
MVEHAEEPSKDSLGLDLDSLKIGDVQVKATPPEKTSTDKNEAPEHPEPQSAVPSDGQCDDEQTEPAEGTDTSVDPVAATSEEKKPPPREKKKPYNNPERVKTGGTQREKLSDDQLAQRMARIREQNEKIKQRRADVEADKQEFRKTQEEERQKQMRNKRVQESVNQAREQNARRKLDKIQNREWDTGKPGVGRSNTAEREPPSNPANQPPAQSARIGIRGGVRGGGGGRGRGRGRGGGPPRDASAKSPVVSPTDENPTTATIPAAAPAPDAPEATLTAAGASA